MSEQLQTFEPTTIPNWRLSKESIDAMLKDVLGKPTAEEEQATYQLVQQIESERAVPRHALLGRAYLPRFVSRS